MHTFIFIIGLLAIGAASAVVIAIAVIAIGAVVGQFIERGIIQGDRKCRDQIADQLACDSWWFSEQPAVEAVMKMYGEEFRRGVKPDVSRIRDRMRKQFPELAEVAG